MQNHIKKHIQESIKEYASEQLPKQFSNCIPTDNVPITSIVQKPIVTKFFLTYEDEVVMELMHTVEPDKPVTIRMDGVIQLAIMRGDLKHVEFTRKGEDGYEVQA